MEYRKEKIGQAFLMGNEAMGRSLLEHGAFCIASYPGTPASEILESAMRFTQEENLAVHTEWSINEKAAFEVAHGCSLAGKRAAVAMKQVGLNVASDPMMSAAYTGIKGGFVILSADDPGPFSSQTEQDSRAFASFAKIPVFDPSTPAEAGEMIGRAFRLSEQYQIPVMVRPTTRVCHARQMVPLYAIPDPGQKADFSKDPNRWAATPKFRFLLHQHLNRKIREIGQFNLQQIERLHPHPNGHGLAIVGSGVAYAYAYDVLEEMNLLDQVPLIKIDIPFPLDPYGLDKLLNRYGQILVFEETYPVVEGQLLDRKRVRGKGDGTVPSEGELTPDIIQSILTRFFKEKSTPKAKPQRPKENPPRLCPGCPHRAAFYALKKALPRGIYPGDIGCYTLGIHMGVVDTCLCMGAGINQAAGLSYAYRDEEKRPPIVATIGDSTFFHSGITGLMNAVQQGARFTLVILDNSITAMTGGQPTIAGGHTPGKESGPEMDLKQVVRACGVEQIEEIDPYDVPRMIDRLKAADSYTRKENGGVAVIVAKRPCLLYGNQPIHSKPAKILIEGCNECGLCTDHFDCPALIKADRRPQVLEAFCTGCGTCRYVCPIESIRKEEVSCNSSSRAGEARGSFC